jgi:Tfp pilus assembly protein PilV
MTSTRRSRLRGLRDRLSGDGGFALIEVMVSAVLVVVLALATLSIIDKSGAAAGITRQRSVATGLAQEDQDSMRVMSVTNLDRRDTTYPKRVNGTTYSVHSVAEWVRDGGLATCDRNTSRVEYLKTTSYVTWPGHEANPVILESYISPGVEAMSKGSLMVKLHTDPGIGYAGQSVVLQAGMSGMTDQTGCVLFTGLDAGTQWAKWDGTATDSVDRNGIQTPQENVVIGAGQTAQVDRLWDKSGRAVVRWVDENGSPVTPTPTPTTRNGGIGAGVTNSLITVPVTPGQTRLFDNRTASVGANTPLDPPIPATNPTTIDKLFPYSQSYGLFAGGCADNAPTRYLSTYTMPTAVVPADGDSQQTDVTVPTALVYLVDARGSAVTDYRLKLVNANNTDANCSDTVTLDATNSLAPTVFHVPYGVYSICVQKGTQVASFRAPQVINVTPPGSTVSPQTQNPRTSTYDTTGGLGAAQTINTGNITGLTNGAC